MKARPPIILLVAATAVVIGIVLWLGRRKSMDAPLNDSVQTANIPIATTAMNSQSGAAVQTNTPVAQSPASSPVSTPSSETREQQLRNELAAYNEADIVLRAQVVDQFGSPVSGATVSAVIGVNNGNRVGQDRLSTSTDSNGFFTISGRKGKDMGITVIKSGYVLADTNTYFVYSQLWPESQRFTLDPNNPVVIKMRKLQGAEPLVSINKEYKLPFTAAPIFFDLAAGESVPSGGDLKITVNRPAGEVSEHNPQKWSINLEVVGGGFIETSDQESAITFSAPEGGYVPSGIFTNNNGTDGLDKDFFIESRNGQVFSKFSFSMGINNEPDGMMYIAFHGVANTNSSRNWEITASQ